MKKKSNKNSFAPIHCVKACLILTPFFATSGTRRSFFSFLNTNNVNILFSGGLDTVVVAAVALRVLPANHAHVDPSQCFLCVNYIIMPNCWAGTNRSATTINSDCGNATSVAMCTTVETSCARNTCW